MKLRRVDPRKIHIPEVRVTARMNEVTAEQFEASVAAVGIDEPMKVYDVDGELWLSDGKHRLVEAIKNNLPMVEVYVREGSMVDVLCNNLSSGHLRGKHPVSEMLGVVEELYKKHHVGIEDIVKRTGLTQGYVENLLLISNLTPLCRAAVDAEELGIRHAVILTKVKNPVDQETFFHMLKLAKFSVKDLDAWIKEVYALRGQQVTPPTLTEPPRTVTIKCFYCQGEFEPAMILNPHTCQGCAGVMIASMVQARQELEKEKNSIPPAPSAKTE